MRLIAILNRQIPLSKAFNALAHMSFGIGHRLKGKPSVDIYFATQAQVREFRSVAVKLNQQSLNNSVFSDLPHTMVGASNDDLLSKVIKTPEAEVNYFASCFVADEIPEELTNLTKFYSQLKGYQSFQGEQSTRIAAMVDQSSEKYSDSEMKINLLLNAKSPLITRLNQAVVACCYLGNEIPLPKQRLLNIKGENEGAYGLTNISFHSLVVTVTGSSYAKIKSAAEKAEDVVCTCNDDVTLAFGVKTNVEAIIKQSETRLFADQLKEADLIPPQENKAPSTDEKSPRSAKKKAPTMMFPQAEKTASSTEDKDNTSSNSLQ